MDVAHETAGAKGCALTLHDWASSVGWSAHILSASYRFCLFQGMQITPEVFEYSFSNNALGAVVLVAF